jgi:hypothetical protein
MSTESKTRVEIPNELRELPIMRYAESVVPEKLKTPEGKKLVSKVLTYGGCAVLVWLLFQNAQALSDATGNLVDFSINAIKFGFFGTIAVVLYLLAPGIVKLLHNMGNALLGYAGRVFDIQMFKAHKGLISKNPIENLEMLQKDAENAIKEVDTKINEADGVRQNFTSDAFQLDKDAEAKFLKVKGIYNDAKTFREEASTLKSKGLNEKSRAKEREADEYEQMAYNLKIEADADKDTALMYSQYSNQFGKAIEILKDNRSAARMYLNATKTSITIIKRKLDATTRMRNASEGIATAFNIKDTWIFQVAMQSAQAGISENIATIRNNIQQLNQNSVLLRGTKSANKAELDQFIQQMESGQIKKLNVSEITNTGYEGPINPEYTIL